MSSSSGKRAVVAALGANLGIALAKVIAWVFSGSTSMLAEGVHSLADSGNQVLLLVGSKKSQRSPDREHPFGYARERYVYAFIVSIILFTIGGVFSLLEGIDKLAHPHTLDNGWLPMIVLFIALCLESFSLRTGLREARGQRSGLSLPQFIRRTKAPELPVVLLEDIAALTGLLCALLGVGLTLITGNAMWDALGTLAIGALLVCVAVILGIETKSLLIGEGVSESDLNTITEAIEADPVIERIVHMKTLYLGPDELLIAAKIALPGECRLHEIAQTINDAEARIRRAIPTATIIYIEPDVWVNQADPNPPTDTIVIKGLD